MKVDFEHGIDILVLFSALEVPPKSTLLYIYYEKKKLFFDKRYLESDYNCRLARRLIPVLREKRKTLRSMVFRTVSLRKVIFRDKRYED